VEAASPAPGVVERLRAALARRPTQLGGACLATAVGAVLVATGLVGGTAPAAAPVVALPISVPDDVPLPGDRASWQEPAQRAAATCPGLPAGVLVAIAQVESRLGHHSGPSAAGARGPMQFLPATWAAYGADGDGDGFADVLNPVDALHGAARLLCANGGAEPDRLDSALWNYNHSDHYVRQVLSMAWLNRIPA